MYIYNREKLNQTRTVDTNKLALYWRALLTINGLKPILAKAIFQKYWLQNIPAANKHMCGVQRYLKRKVEIAKTPKNTLWIAW